MSKLKQLTMALILFCLLLCPSVMVQAETETNQVVDGAELLTTSQIRKLEDQVDELELSSGWDIMVVTTADAGGVTAEYYAETWFDENTTSDDGVICLVDMDNRELVIRTFGQAISYLTDSRIEDILDDAYAGASEEDYNQALSSMLDGVESAYQKGIPSDQYTYDEDTQEVIGRYQEPKKITLIEALVAIVASLAAGGITVAVIVGKYRLKWGGYQYSYRDNGSVTLTDKEDRFVNQVVTHRRIPKQSSSGGSGGSRSTVHSGSGGRSSGGGSRKF